MSKSTSSLILLACAALSLSAAEHQVMSLEDSLQPYSGPVNKGVDTSTLYGKVMCGYQGWFRTADDGYGVGNRHWGGVGETPPSITVDMWPDMRELDEDEKFPTNYKYEDGTPAPVFSSAVKKTVLRHFKWMQESGIDGVFVQRFTSEIGRNNSPMDRSTTAVLSHAREGANTYGRGFAVMYDTSFGERSTKRIKEDWTRLVHQMKILETPAYMKHKGAPIVILWGYGFSHRRFSTEHVRDLFEFLKRPENGGCTIMLGVNNDWLKLDDDKLALIKEYATIISPWTVGRYRSPEQAAEFYARHWPNDLAYCKEHDLDYYAVAFPGFSWYNLEKVRGRESGLNLIPRLKGRFLWSQIEQVKKYGMNMAYVAMFDEVDEGTAIFKVSNNPPVGTFVTYEGLPTDHYMKLTGYAAQYLRGDIAELPQGVQKHFEAE